MTARALPRDTNSEHEGARTFVDERSLARWLTLTKAGELLLHLERRERAVEVKRSRRRSRRVSPHVQRIGRRRVR